MALPSAATALRDSFGDRKVPDITRKITACVACRKQKIKCHMDGSPPCTRCKARGLSCTVNRSLQTLLESDADWKDDVEQRLKRIEQALTDKPMQHDNFPSPTPRSLQATPRNAMEESTAGSSSSLKKLDAVSEVAVNLSCRLGSFPGSSVTNLNFTDQRAHDSHTPDLIASGLVSLEEAEEYFAIYHESMEPCLVRIISEDDCLANIRAQSSFLTAAICAVGSLSVDSAKQKIFCDFFIAQVSSKVFLTRYNFDDVRALCIGAFWLNKYSSALVGLAVRISTELDLHRCITKMPHTKRECIERTRLYFLVYICDHQCALIHGRPPMMREFQSLKSPKVFLQSSLSTPDDLQLISLVELWSVSSRVFDLFGADVEASIELQQATELQSISYALDQCRLDLLASHAAQDTLSDYSREVFELGSSQRSESSMAAINGLEKFERFAVDGALSIVQSVTWSGEIQAHLEMLPSYFGTMIAFAFVFLLKASTQKRISLVLDKNNVFRSLKRLAEVFSACSARAQPEHPLHSITKSLEIAMKRHGFVDLSEGEQMVMPQDESMLAFDNFGSDPFGMNNFAEHDSLFHSPMDGFQINFWGLENL